jgi:hypothetical protein
MDLREIPVLGLIRRKSPALLDFRTSALGIQSALPGSGAWPCRSPLWAFRCDGLAKECRHSNPGGLPIAHLLTMLGGFDGDRPVDQPTGQSLFRY